VIAYSVTQRTREIGIRMAVGARPEEVVRLILGTGSRLVAIGIGVGILGALASSTAIAGLIFGTSPRDPIVLGAVCLVLGGVALLASWLPARRAARVDPMTALQAE
jgi:ABC-type antimicrobial peptide transport system permease subunit